MNLSLTQLTRLAALLLTVLATAPGCAMEEGDAEGEDEEELASTEQGVASVDEEKMLPAKLFVRHRAKTDCAVKANLEGGGPGWTIPSGTILIWRYNANGSYALVSDPKRADKGLFPWWGFAPRDCIGPSIKQTNAAADQPVPSRLLQGRSHQADGWRPVEFDEGTAKVVGTEKLSKNATLRDKANFVVGNCMDGATVNKTKKTRSSGHWIYVECPSAGRWGWIEKGKL
jgi:hypothetical protein